MGDPGETPFYSVINATWPDLLVGRTLVSPPRNGMDRFTGKMLSGWPHVEQSLEILFETNFHERILRRWVGTFVPLILGRSIIARMVTRFAWAIISAIDLYEPCYRIRQIYFMGDAVPWQPQGQLIDAAELLRQGEVMFRQDGIYYPRGHLGDFTPYDARAYSAPAVRRDVTVP